MWTCDSPFWENPHDPTTRSYAKDVMAAIDGLPQNNFLGEPVGRDTLNAVGFAAAVLAARDPDAIFAVLTSDHIIEPQSVFAQKVDLGFRLVEADPSRIVTFSITPTFPATAYKRYSSLAQDRLSSVKGANSTIQERKHAKLCGRKGIASCWSIRILQRL